MVTSARIPKAAGLILGALWLALAPRAASAQGAAPGDVYYKVHVDQSYKPGPFVQDLVVWENRDIEGIAPSFTAFHDTVQPDIAVFDSVAFEASAGRFNAHFRTQITLAARTGIWNSLVNSLRVEVFVKGNAGTAYHVELAGSGQLTVSRWGGRPGSLQAVNGISTATFLGSTATIDSTGVLSQPVYEPQSYAGHSLDEITVGADTYSHVGTYFLHAPARVTQTYCILGCMVEAADFNAATSGHVQIDVYPCQDPLKRQGTGADGWSGEVAAVPCAEVPTGAPATPGETPALVVQAAPNPFNPTTIISFQAERGDAARVEVLDARGRLVARLFDGVATGVPQTLAWRARGQASGVYALRVESGGQQRTRKLTLLK